MKKIELKSYWEPPYLSSTQGFQANLDAIVRTHVMIALFAKEAGQSWFSLAIPYDVVPAEAQVIILSFPPISHDSDGPYCLARAVFSD